MRNRPYGHSCLLPFGSAGISKIMGSVILQMKSSSYSVKCPFLLLVGKRLFIAKDKAFSSYRLKLEEKRRHQRNGATAGFCFRRFDFRLISLWMDDLPLDKDFVFYKINTVKFPSLFAAQENWSRIMSCCGRQKQRHR